MKQTKHSEYIILGAGPAGLQMGFYMEQDNRDYLIIDRAAHSGSFFNQFPRNRKLISINKVHTGHTNPELNLRWDWNSLLSNGTDRKFKEYSKDYFPEAESLVKYLNDYTVHHKLNVLYNCNITKIGRSNLFKLEDSQGNSYTCKVLIVATGVTLPNTPNIPGVELCDNYFDLSSDKLKYQNKKVLIIGKGNSAFETADHLMDTTSLTHLCSPSMLKLAWQTHYVGHLRAVNNNLLDTYHLKSQNAIIDATILSIEKMGNQLKVKLQYNNETREFDTLLYDHIILCAGFKWDSSLFESNVKPDTTINDRFPAQTCEWESINVEDLYFAGTIMQQRDFKKYTSGFIHGFRYNVSALYRFLKRKYHGISLEHSSIDISGENLANKFMERIRVSSSIWQQPGFLCDAAVRVADTLKYYTDIPVDYVHDKMIQEDTDIFILTMEYGAGREPGDHTSVKRIAVDDYKNAELSKFIHPVVRHWEGNRLTSTHHVIEDFAIEWMKDYHFNPLNDFLQLGLTGNTTYSK